MQIRKISFRVLKLLGKAIVGLLLLMMVLLLVVHMPFSQRKITRSLTTYLSSKTNATVDIGRIKFSLLGNLQIEELKLLDTDSQEVFSVGTIKVESSIFNLISGKYLIKNLYIANVKGHLAQLEDGLNIQFLLDAFQPLSPKEPSTQETIILLDQVRFENFAFTYSSIVSGTELSVSFESMTSSETKYSTIPSKFSSTSFFLHRADIIILSSNVAQPELIQDSSGVQTLFVPDFGIGMELDIADLEISDSQFSFHTPSVVHISDFDPNHIDLTEVQICILDLRMEADSLSAQIDGITAQLPGFELTDLKAVVQGSRQQLKVSELSITSGSNEIIADIDAFYAASPFEGEEALNLVVATTARIYPDDLDYLLPDEMMQYFKGWDTTQLSIEGNYTNSRGDIKVLHLQTGNSQLDAHGVVMDMLDMDKLSWQDLDINATIGTAFRSLMTSMIGDIRIPPSLTLDINSTGSLSKMTIDGEILSTWGDVTANGVIAPQGKNIDFDLDLIGKRLYVNKWVDLPWLGFIDLTAHAKGRLGQYQDALVNGHISSIGLMDQRIHDIAFKSIILGDSITADVTIADPDFRSKIHTGISYEGPMLVNGDIQLDSFNVGKLMKMDSTLIVSGGYVADLKSIGSTIDAHLQGYDIFVERQSRFYTLDTMSLDALLSPGQSSVVYNADDAAVSITSNFDLQQSPEMLQRFASIMFNPFDSLLAPAGTRQLRFDASFSRPDLIQLMGIEVTDFSTLKMTGEVDEATQRAVLDATSGTFSGYGVTMDTMLASFIATDGMVDGGLRTENLMYSSYDIGHLELDVNSKGDTILTKLHLFRDTSSYLELHTRFLPDPTGLFVYPDQLKLFDHTYALSSEGPVIISDSNVIMDQFLISRDEMQINVDGDLNAFEAYFRNMDLTHLNQFLSSDSMIIRAGRLNGNFSYVRDQVFDLKASIDSLRLYDAEPIKVNLTALKAGNEVPFTFLMTSANNNLDASGTYFFNREEIDAAIKIDINDLHLFSFLVSDVLADMYGAVKGDIKVHGPLQKPILQGSIRFLEAGFTTSNPTFTFEVKDDILYVDPKQITLKGFKIYDEEQHPLTLTGHLTTNELPAYSYDLAVETEEFTLMNTSESSQDNLKGLLAIAGAVQLKGNEKDTYVNAKLSIKNSTDLTYVYTDDDIDLLKTDGIIEFVDPGMIQDTSNLQNTQSYIDSLVASLPDFSLNSLLTIENEAKIRIVTNSQSGDYLQASGGGVLELGYDRAGALQITGAYTIDHGVYRVSFYDLVKKNFQLVKGSSIHWRGSPQNGDLDIQAEYTVASNSIGLIAHEIAENEQSIYKRSLDYVVGIKIQGTIEKPIVSFSLDLPKEEKANYPVLASKLDRLKLPEFQSELNKQVFGLLVIGGFLPETSGNDVDQGQIATTALTNSVNSLLAGQLNRFAGQYIKGVNIDVGLQSYNDYSTPGGKTTTAMDFRVSKSILDDRLSFEIGGDFDINADQSGGSSGDNYRGDVAIIYDLTGNGDKQLKLFNNETYDIIYQEIRNTGISLVFIREFNKGEKPKRKDR